MKKTRLKRSRFQIYNNSNVSHTTLEKVDPEQQSELRAKAAADKAAKAAKSALCALLYTFKLLEVDTRDVRTAFRYDQIDLGSAAVITTLIIKQVLALEYKFTEEHPDFPLIVSCRRSMKGFARTREQNFSRDSRSISTFICWQKSITFSNCGCPRKSGPHWSMRSRKEPRL